jgi:cytochrome P450
MRSGPDTEAALRSGFAAGRVWRDADAWRIAAFEAARELFMDPAFRFPPPPPLADVALPPPILAAARRGRDVQARWFALESELHLKVRPVIAAALSGAAVAKLQARLRAQAGEMLGAAAGGQACLRDFSVAFPRRIQLDLFGIAEAERAAVIERATLAAALFPHRKADPLRAWIAHAALQDVIQRGLDRPAPDGALMLAAMQAALAAGRLEREEAAAALSVTMIAGMETSGFALTGLLARLAADPATRSLARSGDAALDALIEEELRFSSGPKVVGCFDRDLELAEGVRIPAGERLMVDVRQANHDPARFADADRFAPDREDGGHIAFGAGVHICVGRHFARLHLRVGALAFLDCLPRLLASCPDEVARLADGVPANAA